MIYALVTLSALLGTHSTYWLTHKVKMDAIRASALVTILFVVATNSLPLLFVPQLQAAFYGGTFVGMSEPSRLDEKSVLLASAVFSLVFCFLMKFRGGIGGTLGATAFLGCLVIYSVRWVGKGLRSEKPA